MALLRLALVAAAAAGAAAAGRALLHQAAPPDVASLVPKVPIKFTPSYTVVPGAEYQGRTLPNLPPIGQSSNQPNPAVSCEQICNGYPGCTFFVTYDVACYFMTGVPSNPIYSTNWVTYVKLNYSWTLGAPGASCTASCAAARLQCFPAAKPGWAGWPRTAAAFEGVLASVPGGAGLCKADVEPSTRGGVEPVTFTSDGNCYFDPKGQDSCAGAPPPALSGALARRLCPCSLVSVVG